MKTLFVCYYRVSTLKQSLGMEAQKEAVKRYLGSLDCEVIGSFEEVESGGNNDRAQLQAAIALAKARQAVLVIAKLDRLSRNAAFLMQLLESSCDFCCCDMPHADKFSVGIFALLAQKERELISQRTKAGLAVAKTRGKVGGNPRAAEAWKKAQTAIQGRKTAFAADALKAIREIQSTGVSALAKIADCMNKRGEKTPRGGKWTATTVRRTLISTGTVLA